MSFNLLDLVKDQVGGQLIKHATGMLGESESGVSKALGGIFPAVLGSVISKGTDEGSAGKMLDLVKGVDPGILGNIGGLLGGATEDKPDSLMNMGTGLLSSLMGNKLGGAVDLISKVGGIKSGSAMSLFKMATPFLIGLISKKVKSDNMGVSGFMNLLSDQKEAVNKAMPAGMGSLMGLSNILGGAKDMATGAAATAASAVTGAATTAKNTATNTATAAKKGGSSLFKWLIPLLLILAAAYFLTQSSMCKDTAVGDAIGGTMEKGMDATKAAANKAADVTKDAGNAVADGAKSVGAGLSKAFGNVNESAKNALSSISFAAGSAGQQMMDYINGNGEGDSKFTFNNLNFESGSARIAGESGAEVDNLAAIMKAYPDVKIQIDGYTDSDGDDTANKELSEARASAVKARLVSQEIDASRITTLGFGEENPIATNGTPEGRAKNRRIEVRVTN